MLVGKTIFLRAPEPEDIEILYKIENDIHLWETSQTISPFSKKYLLDYIGQSHLSIFRTRQLRMTISTNVPEVVGFIDLFDFEPHTGKAGVGIVIEASFRRKGFASEALALLITYAFKTLRLHQLYANISEHNTESIKLFKNQGFEVYGIKKDWAFWEHNYTDVLFLQLINTIT